jgi:hypothetical protein
MLVHPTRWRRARLAVAYGGALAALILAAAGATAAKAGASPADSAAAPIVTTNDGSVRGAVVPRGTPSSGCPMPLPLSATCGGAPAVAG